MLVADRTVRIGDLVEIGKTEGVVGPVGRRTTRGRRNDDSPLTIPNADLTTAQGTYRGARRRRRFRTQINAPDGTPADLLTESRAGTQEEPTRVVPGSRS